MGAAFVLMVVASRVLVRPVVYPRALAVIWAALGTVTVLLLTAKATSDVIFGLVAVAAVVISSDQLRVLYRFATFVVGIAVTLQRSQAVHFPLSPMCET